MQRQSGWDLEWVLLMVMVFATKDIDLAHATNKGDGGVFTPHTRVATWRRVSIDALGLEWG